MDTMIRKLAANSLKFSGDLWSMQKCWTSCFIHNIDKVAADDWPTVPSFEWAIAIYRRIDFYLIADRWLVANARETSVLYRESQRGLQHRCSFNVCYVRRNTNQSLVDRLKLMALSSVISGNLSQLTRSCARGENDACVDLDQYSIRVLNRNGPGRVNRNEPPQKYGK